MDLLLEKMFENKSPNEISTMLINLNKLQLNSKKHIKKYNKLRKLHSEIIDSMKNSYVGLFKVIDTDRSDGYITYEDVFTKKKFKVIDIAMSSTLKVDKKRMIYVYNRIITFDDISFGTGIHCMMNSEHKLLKEFIKKHKYRNYSDFSRCLLLYDLSKKDNDLTVGYNNQYGYRR